ncbi:hypothetical protein F442_21360 [Phytophthora nicotianae P10297]|uniref:Uncharacterized protein n=3 Tax=Phytophthora nicotianae TaxID=4792 RepID=V9DXB2_PHYNI|nr:hypothetical protein F443_21523 [Phytophthora nicotianae P1569]ETM31819.1 hypothetical protein L914_20667 [Phytophthora nicotianae]ETP29490.1 hypothetical protein F442_21360 [Phytophthora nicotianae P10297]
MGSPSDEMPQPLPMDSSLKHQAGMPAGSVAVFVSGG